MQASDRLRRNTVAAHHQIGGASSWKRPIQVLPLALAALLISTSVASAQQSHAVKGYVKSNGTYVAPTRATNPNRTNVDNYSTKPNVNPYSGKAGTKAPDYSYKPPKAYTAPRIKSY